MIKSLAVPKTVHLVITLPSLDNNCFHLIETLFFYSFIWKRKTMINTVENGGLKIIGIRTFDKALKVSCFTNS